MQSKQFFDLTEQVKPVLSTSQNIQVYELDGVVHIEIGVANAC